MPNVELLQQTMQHIKDHPEQHDQHIWVNSCGTAGCFAGWAALLSGWFIEDLRYYGDFRWTTFGRELLDLTPDEAFKLFCSSNTVPMLELMVKDLVNGDEMRKFEDYAEEVS